jgi:flagellar motor switch protein FliM
VTIRGQLSQQEIDALLAGASGQDGDDQASTENQPDLGEVLLWDVASLEHITRGRMPTLEIVNQRFAGHLLEGLFNLTGRRFLVSGGELKPQKYSAFVSQLAAPTSCSIMSIRPLQGQALVVCDQALVGAVVDALFGGTATRPTRLDGRDFSPAEQRVMSRLNSVIADACNQAWRGILPLRFELLRTESRPEFANVAATGERVVTSSFQLETGELAGSVHICLTHASLEPVRETLGFGVLGNFIEGDTRWVDLLRHEVPAVEVTLEAKFAPLNVTMAQVLAMKVGDFIGLDDARRIDATVGGVPLFECLFGTHKAKYAIRIVKGLGRLDARNDGGTNE